MKRLLKRKGIAGFSEDSGRVLAGFIYSNARRTSSNLHSKETTSAVDAIPKQKGELKDVAVKLQEYVSVPQEEAQAFRGILFAQYLGVSIASAIVNASQPFTVTLPYLSQFGGIRKAAAQMASATKLAARMEAGLTNTTGNVQLDAALKKAEEEGIVSPQEVHALQAQAAGKAQLQSGDGTTMGNALATASNGLSKLSLAWGKVFGVAEQFNRRTTFIAAYRTAVEQGNANPAAFAEKAVSETQFVYNKANKPRWARGTAGSILFTFKQYSVNYLELVARMATAGKPGSPERQAGQKAALLAIAILFMMAGADGLPFAEDIQDVLDGIMQRLGYNISTKQAVKSFLANQLGKDGAAFVMNGVSGVPGIPIDVSGRLGMGNLIPGTGLAQKKVDHTRDLAELAGPGGDFVKRAFNATEQALTGDVVKAMGTISPVASRNAIKAIDMTGTGMYRDDGGRKVIETTGTEAFLKGIGFQPRNVKEVQDASREVQRSTAQYILASG
ncbi:PLxRFG domain-containing protein, partial [bacterium]|nr:PLxRFG domain-containing protein [bacterium]